MVELPATADMAHGKSFAQAPALPRIPALPAGMLLALSDLAAIFLLPLAGSLLHQSREHFYRNVCFWSLLALISILLTASHGGYRRHAPSRPMKSASIAVNCFIATASAMLALAILLGHPMILTRRWTLVDLILTPLLLLGVRRYLPQGTAAAAASRPSGTLVICYDDCPRDLCRALAEKQLSADIAGILYLAPQSSRSPWHEWPQLADQSALQHKIQNGNVQDIIFTYHPDLDGAGFADHQSILEQALGYSARIWLALDLGRNLPPMLQERAASCKLIPIVTDELISSKNPFKRLFDLIVASILLVLFAPVFLICAALVRVSGPGPVIFRQRRTGAHGRQFDVLKFRTMRDAPNQAFVQAQKNDPRVTKIGRLLRRTSMDETLQLINVICGDMSLVGPRPHAPETQVEGIGFENALRLYQLRHRVKPGITGLAQIRGQRGATPVLTVLEQRLASDLEYIQSWSPWLDISILLQTIPAVLTQKNAF